jgi:phospholipid/cholesterol/gamma-HCH transport system substrate-binding protein
MKDTIETRLGVFIALATVAAFIILHLIGGVNLFNPGYRLRAEFNNIQALKPGDEVKMAGVQVGSVEKVSLDQTNDKVLVTLRMNKEVMVRTDSKATIKFVGLMGDNYVSVDFGTATSPALEPDSIIATTEQPDLSALMAKLDEAAGGVQNLTKSFTGDKIDNLLGPFTDFMKQNSPRLGAILANVQAVTAEVAQGKGTVGKMINSDELYTAAYATVTNLQDVSGSIKGTVAKAQGIVDQINSGQGTVGKLVKDETLYRETTASMTNLKEILQKINQGQGSVGKLVNDQEFYRNAKLSLQKVDKAMEGLEDTGPLSVVGTLATSLF